MNCEIGLQDVFKGDYRGTCENIVNKLIQVKSLKKIFYKYIFTNITDL